MADDRQPPQAYDTVAPAGVGAATSNQMSPRAWQDLYLTGDQGLLDVAMEEIAPDALTAFLQSLPSPNTIAGWPDVGGASPAGVGSQASHTPSTVSVRTPTPSPSPSTQRRQFTQRTLAAAGAGGGDDDGSGGSRRSTPRGRRRGGPVRHP